MKNIIKKLAKEFNKSNIVWGIGGSYLLKRYGINIDSNEIDILISEDSIDDVVEIMNSISAKQEFEDDEHFHSTFYAVYQINGININVISNLSYEYEEDFSYVFNQEDINVHEVEDNERINYCHLMDWYIIYKEIKMKTISSLIETYYKNGGFIDNSRFHKKFDLVNLSVLHKNYNKLRTMIY
jgi:hypothetical protein